LTDPIQIDDIVPWGNFPNPRREASPRATSLWLKTNGTTSLHAVFIGKVELKWRQRKLKRNCGELSLREQVMPL
jgi:hypothetical protein